MVKFSLRLKELREEQNVSQKELAKFLNVTQSTVAKWETGDREPSFIIVEKIMNYFNVSSDYLLGFID